MSGDASVSFPKSHFPLSAVQEVTVFNGSKPISASHCPVALLPTVADGHLLSEEHLGRQGCQEDVADLHLLFQMGLG